MVHWGARPRALRVTAMDLPKLRPTRQCGIASEGARKQCRSVMAAVPPPSSVHEHVRKWPRDGPPRTEIPESTRRRPCVTCHRSAGQQRLRKRTARPGGPSRSGRRKSPKRGAPGPLRTSTPKPVLPRKPDLLQDTASTAAANPPPSTSRHSPLAEGIERAGKRRGLGAPPPRRRPSPRRPERAKGRRERPLGAGTGASEKSRVGPRTAERVRGGGPGRSPSTGADAGRALGAERHDRPGGRL